MSAEPPGFLPLVAADERQPELTLRALVLGALLGVVFGAASTYLALRVGLTVSASVPIAVVAIALLRPRAGRRAILEHNITQTTGSAGESVAAAVVFTVPALIFLGYPLEVGATTLIALTGGLLGVLMMVPLRRYLIVKEHGKLRYPEGRACAEILDAGEQGGTSARKVFLGIGAGAALKAVVQVLHGAKETIAAPLDGLLKGAAAACDIGPELLGVGYIIGYRTAVTMVAGSLLASFILIPMIVLFGGSATQAIPPGADPIRAIYEAEGAGGIWDHYVRHIGAGAVATGGVFALVRALPAIASSLRASLRALGSAGGAPAAVMRTDRDTPLPVLLGGALLLTGFLWAVPMFHMNLLGAVLILVLGFLFSVVSSRVTGEVGSTSSPLSGMTIGVLMATCGVFLLAGWEGSGHARLALLVGAVVCIAISNAGTCSQDLKTGFLVGATPVRQQGALLAGVLTSVLAIGWTASFLNLAQSREHPVRPPFAVAQAVVDRGTKVASLREPGRTLVFVRLAREIPAGTTVERQLDAGPGSYLVDAGSGQARFFAAPDGPAALDRPFPVASGLLRGAVPAEHAGGHYLRVALDEVPMGVTYVHTAGATPGNYLVDPATREVVSEREDGIGSGRLEAPQARLMSVVIDGLLTHSLPWDLVALGVAIALFMELLGVRSLTFAVGVYLPLSSTMPVFLGGLVRRICDLVYRREPDAESESEGTLFSSGVIAGASILGILAAMLTFLPGRGSALAVLERPLSAWVLLRAADGSPAMTGQDLLSLCVLLLLGWLLFRQARDRAP